MRAKDKVKMDIPPEDWQKFKKRVVVVEAYRNVSRHTISLPKRRSKAGRYFDFVEVKVGSWIIKGTCEVLTQEEFTARYEESV